MALIKTTIAALGLATIASLASANAQLSSDGGPIRVNADKSEVLERDRQVLLIDNVDITQGEARLRADHVTLNYAGNANATGGGMSGFGDIETMVARGRVFYVTPDLKATGDKGVYDARADTITLDGNVILIRGEDVAKGEQLVMNLTEGRTVLNGGKSNQVQMVITPREGEPASN